MSDVIARAREVLAAATPGPWCRVTDIDDPGAAVDIRKPLPGARWGRTLAAGMASDDARAIVLAVNALPALLALAEACVQPAGPADKHLRCRLCDVTARELVHEPGCPLDRALAALREAL